MVSAGPRVNLLRIETEVQTGLSEIFEPVMEWRKWRDVLASGSDRRGNEHFDETNQRYAETETRFEVDYFDIQGIDEKARFIFEGVTYNIKNILWDHIRKQTAVMVAVRQV